MDKIVLATSLYVSKDLIQKLLGPSVEYLGQEVRDVLKRNLSKILNKAINKVGEDIDKPGVVPPRVIKEVYDSGAYCEDDLSQEYYAGLLATSRGKNIKDDLLVPLLDILKGLSSYQIRMHYLVYWHISKIFRSSKLNIGIGSDRYKMQIFIPFETAAIGLNVRDRKDWNDIVDHSLLGLETKDLIEKENTFSGKADFITEQTNVIVSNPGIVVAPSLLGAELFLRSLGIKQGTGRDIVGIDAGENMLRMDGKEIRRLWYSRP